MALLKIKLQLLHHTGSNPVQYGFLLGFRLHLHFNKIQLHSLIMHICSWYPAATSMLQQGKDKIKRRTNVTHSIPECHG